MALLGDIIGCFILAVMVYMVAVLFGGLEQYEAIPLSVVVLGSLLGLVRGKQGNSLNSFDKFGVYAGILYSVCVIGWLFSDIGSPISDPGAADVIVLFIVLTICFLPAFAIYGLFAFLGMILPAPSGRRRRPARSERPYDYPGHSGHGDDVDPDVYGGRRNPPPPQGPPGGGSNGQAGDAQRPQPAPSDAARLDYQPAQGYSTEYAQQLFRASRVRGAPSNSKAASQLAGHCLAALGPHAGMAFLNAAARDDKLPNKTRQFYAHALMEMERRTAGN